MLILVNSRATVKDSKNQYTKEKLTKYVKKLHVFLFLKFWFAA